MGWLSNPERIAADWRATADYKRQLGKEAEDRGDHAKARQWRAGADALRRAARGLESEVE